jgi:hypothetical protein
VVVVLLELTARQGIVNPSLKLELLIKQSGAVLYNRLRNM